MSCAGLEFLIYGLEKYFNVLFMMCLSSHHSFSNSPCPTSGDEACLEVGSHLDWNCLLYGQKLSPCGVFRQVEYSAIELMVWPFMGASHVLDSNFFISESAFD